MEAFKRMLIIMWLVIVIIVFVTGVTKVLHKSDHSTVSFFEEVTE